MSKEFIWPIRLYADDIDFYGIVYHGKYIEFMDRGRTEWMISLGYGLEYMAQRDVKMAVYALEVKYSKPAYLGDQLEVVTRLADTSRTCLHFEQIIRSEINPGLTYCHARITVVCLNNKMRPCAIPKELVERMND